ncbi:hypothetical protein ACPPVT_15345 [Angustibacter sp. McL0619]|uniref:hypothetical protein n=1 Tax=Angustibacter sp. McL0619 TaxID=3415676 RepID=UPI003CE8A24E
MSIMQLVGFLSDDEADLVRETEVERMAVLDEDDLLALHARVRRARTKYVKLYRRQAAARVGAKGARGSARPANRRNADKAEVFELALARVSKRVDVVARAAAAELKAERLAAAKAAKAAPVDRRQSSGAAAKPTAGTAAKPTSRTVAHSKTTGAKKRDASSKAAGARRQAKRDSR